MMLNAFIGEEAQITKLSDNSTSVNMAQNKYNTILYYIMIYESFCLNRLLLIYFSNNAW